MAKHKEKKKKTIMKEFALHEISAVDRPAQVGASMVIMKRRTLMTFAEVMGVVEKHDPEWVKKFIKNANTFDEILEQRQAEEIADQAMDELFGKMGVLIESLDSILDDQEISASQMTTKIKASVEQFVGALGPGMSEAVAKTDKTINDPALSGVFHAGTPGSNEATKGNDPMADKDLTKELGDLKTQIEALTKTAKDAETAIALEKKRADAAESIASLSDVEKGFYAKLGDDDKASFVNKSESDRTLQIKRASEGDEVLEVHGQRVVKSEVGTAIFNIMKAQANEMADTTKRLDEERDANLLASFTKRAEDEFGMLPGEPVAKAKALLAINKVKGEELDTIEAMLKSGNAAMVAMAKAQGSDNPHGGTAEESLNALAKSYASDKNVDYHTAYAKVLETPEGAEFYAETTKN